MKAGSIIRFLYNPSRMPEQELLARFIVRENEFRILWEDLEQTKRNQVDQHFLIVGQRGMGKTTLMLKAAYEINRSTKLQDWLIPVTFPEELFGVSDLLGLWQYLAEELEDIFPGLEQEVAVPLEKASEEGVLEAICKRLAKEKKKLVLFIDNFGDLLDELDALEVHRLREVLMASKDIRLVAASARLIDQTYDYNKPFFDFFNTVYLDGLDSPTTKRLMNGLAASIGATEQFAQMLAQQPNRVEAIRRLTGGVPRLLLPLFSSMMEGTGSEVLEDLEGILDQVSPPGTNSPLYS